MTPPRKKLIEVSLPLEAINAASAREKSIRHGHPSTLHLWWARRPLAACRAVLFAQLVDDPSAWPERFPTEAAVEKERERLHQVIRDFVDWPGSSAPDRARWEKALDAARVEVARSLAWGRGEEPPRERRDVLDYLAAHAAPVYDPFCGGGSIPLEAQRLGLRAYGSDLNPVAVLISKALVEIPPKFAGRAPVRPGGQDDALRQWRGAEGLAEDVRHYGAWMREQAKQRIGRLYPDATLPDGRKATVIAWLWARTVRSPDPAARGARVPLASSFILSSKAGREAIVKVVRDGAAPDGWRFEVKQGGVTAAELATAKNGTKASRGANFVCALTGAAIDGDWIKVEGAGGRLGDRLMAIVAEGERKRVYLSPSHDHEKIAADARPAWKPDTALPDDPRNFWTIPYGLRTYGDLFTDRQLVALTTFSDLVGEAREKALADARAAFATQDATPLADGGAGPAAYADAVATYLAFAVDKVADYGSSIASWHSSKEIIRNTFARQAIAMTWDFVEPNVFSDSSGNFGTAVDYVVGAIAANGAISDGAIFQIDAPANSYPIRPVAIATDPPYYDNIGYADLSDFFYVWLRRSLGSVWPALFRRLQTPKQEELVATPYRFGGKAAAEAHFMAGMGRAIAGMRAASAEGVPLTIYYAFKQSEATEDGVTSAGWASFLRAVVDAGLVVDGTWPVRTELGNRMIGMGANALASSVVLVCRPRSETAPATTRRDFIAELRRELPAAIDHMNAADLKLVDLPQAAIGPGMAVFSKYAAVREASDAAMSVATAIALINQVREEIDHAETADLDPATRFALTWFESFGWGAKRAGEAIKLAQSYALAERELVAAGVLVTERGEARLRRRGEMADDWRPSRDATLTAWEFAQALNRALNDGAGVAGAGALLAEAPGLAADARWLAGRMFGLAEAKGLSEEARGWGALEEAWAEIEAAAETAQRAALATVQGEMF